MTMTAPPREPQNLYDALSTIYDWLCDDRLTQWPYMENGPFYSDLPKYQEVARAALAAAPAPSAEPPATDAPCSSCGQTAGFHTLRCRDKNAASELRATHCSNEGLHDSAADLIEQQARALAENVDAYAAQVERAERAESALAARDAALTLIMRNADAAKEPCGTDPESAAAIRNGKLASLAQIAAQVLGLVRGPDLIDAARAKVKP